MKNGRVHDINAASSRSPSRLSVSGRSSRSSMSAYIVGEKNRIKELMESGSGNKVRQTLQMILMVIIPIIALLSFTTVALISALETSAQASQAKKQMKLIFQVSWISSNSIVAVAFWVNKPLLNTRNVEQTKMYVCTLEEFILVDVVTLLYMDELNMHGKILVYIHSQQRNENYS